MAEHTETLSKKSHIVQNGLNTGEVTECLMEDVGSSDTVFKKLEHFSALEKMADTIEDAINQARDMAEHAKAKAEEEAESRKAQAIEDGKEIAAKIINEAGKSVLAYFDNNSSILMQIMDEAFKKAREQVASNRTKTREQIEKGVWAEIDRIVKGVEHKSRDLSKSERQSTDMRLDSEAASTISPSQSDPWQDAR